MSLERELAALNRRLNDLKRMQEVIHMRVFTRNHDEPYPADARDGDLVVTIEPPLNWDRFGPFMHQTSQRRSWPDR